MRSAMMVLTLAFVLSAVPVGVAAPQVPDVPEVPTLPKDPEIRNYRLSMQKMRQVIEVMRNLNAAAEANPELVRQIERDAEAVSERPPLKEAAAQFEKYPAFRSAFSRAGTSAYDYTVAAAAMGHAWFSLEIKEGRLNPQAAHPPETPAEKANLALLESNRAEWIKLRDEFIRLAENSPFMQ